MEEQVHLKYGQKVSERNALNVIQIALKSILNDNYVRVNHQEGTATARGHHPILYVSFLGHGLRLKAFGGCINLFWI